MKIIISESRLEKLALNYIKKELGEFHPILDSAVWVGEFIKYGSVVCKISVRKGVTTFYMIHIDNQITMSSKNMFDLSFNIIDNLTIQAVKDITGVEADAVFTL
jgi:hypothetical protein